MAARKLLIASYYFPPCAAVAAHRILGFARHLPKFGWHTVVVAPPQMPGEPEDAALLERVPPHTTVVPVPFPGGWWGKVRQRLRGDAAWLPRALAGCVRAIHQHHPQAILSTGPPHCVHQLGLTLQQRYRLPWIATLRDPWHTNKTYRHEDERCIRRAAAAERLTLERADAVVANTPLNCRGLQQAYPHLAHKITTITNGFDPESFPASAPRLPRDRLVVLHAGELYSGRDPRPFLDAVHDIEGEGGSRLTVRLLGRDTEHLCDLKVEVRQRNLESVVHFAGQVPYAEALREMVDADILLLLHSPGWKLGVPAKLYEYLGAARPVLALAERGGDIDWVLRTSGLPHRVAPPLDRAAIKIALRELAREAMLDTAAPRPIVTQFTRENLAGLLAERLDALAPAAGPGPARETLLAGTR